MAERADITPLRRTPRPEPGPRQPLEAVPRQPPEPGPRRPPPQEPLWREVLGQRLRTLRADQRETLSQTARRAGISPQYLSEVERGRKEPSSEMIAALAGALGITLTELTEQLAGDLRRQQDVVAGLRRRRDIVTDLRRPQRTPRAAGPVMLALAA